MASANSFITPQMVTREVLIYLENKRTFTRNVNTQFDKRFGVQGAQIGSRLEIRLPQRFIGTSGNAFNPDAISDNTVALVMGNPFGVHLDISTVDWTLSIEDFRERYAKNMASQIDNTLEVAGLATSIGAYQTVGTYGTTPSSLDVLTSAAAALDAIGVPRDGNRHCLLNPAANGAIVTGLATLYNPQNMISEQYRRGIMLDTVDLIMNMSQNIQVVTNGTQTNRTSGATVLTTSSQGDTTLALTGLLPTSTGTISVGEVIEVGDSSHPINLVNYENRSAIPNARLGTYGTAQFVVTAPATTTAWGTAGGTSYTVDASGHCTVSVSPTITAPVSGVNVQAQTLDSLPQAGATVKFMGSPSASYPVNFVYHKDAFALAMARLWCPKGEAHIEEMYGVPMRNWTQGDIDSNTEKMRLETMAAWLLARPEMIVRITG